MCFYCVCFYCVARRCTPALPDAGVLLLRVLLLLCQMQRRCASTEEKPVLTLLLKQVQAYASTEAHLYLLLLKHTCAYASTEAHLDLIYYTEEGALLLSFYGSMRPPPSMEAAACFC